MCDLPLLEQTSAPITVGAIWNDTLTNSFYVRGERQIPSWSSIPEPDIPPRRHTMGRGFDPPGALRSARCHDKRNRCFPWHQIPVRHSRYICGRGPELNTYYQPIRAPGIPGKFAVPLQETALSCSPFPLEDIS